MELITNGEKVTTNHRFEGKPLQLTDFFDILRPKEIEILGHKTWLCQHGYIGLVFMRTRHIPDSATSIDEAQWCSGFW